MMNRSRQFEVIPVAQVPPHARLLDDDSTSADGLAAFDPQSAAPTANVITSPADGSGAIGGEE